MKTLIRLLVMLCALAMGVPLPVAAQEPWTFREGRGITLNSRASAAIGLEVRAAEDAGDGLAVRVPATALLETVRGDFVYTRNGDAFLRVPIKPGQQADGMIEILDGLFEGDEVVSCGAYELWMIELQAVNGGRGCADGH